MEGKNMELEEVKTTAPTDRRLKGHGGLSIHPRHPHFTCSSCFRIRTQGVDGHVDNAAVLHRSLDRALDVIGEQIDISGQK